MQGEDLYKWAETAEEGDEVSIKIGDVVEPYLTGTVDEVIETDDGREIYLEDDEHNRYFKLTDGELQVHVETGGPDE